MSLDVAGRHVPQDTTKSTKKRQRAGPIKARTVGKHITAWHIRTTCTAARVV